MDELLERIAITLAEAYAGERAIPTSKDREAAKSLVPLIEDLMLQVILQDRLTNMESAIKVDLENL